MRYLSLSRAGLLAGDSYRGCRQRSILKPTEFSSDSQEEDALSSSQVISTSSDLNMTDSFGVSQFVETRRNAGSSDVWEDSASVSNDSESLNHTSHSSEVVSNSYNNNICHSRQQNCQKNNANLSSSNEINSNSCNTSEGNNGNERKSTICKKKGKRGLRRRGVRARLLYGGDGTRHSVRFSIYISVIFALSVFCSRMYRNYLHYDSILPSQSTNSFYTPQQREYNHNDKTGYHEELETSLEVLEKSSFLSTNLFSSIQSPAGLSAAGSRQVRSTTNDDCPSQAAWERR